VRLGVNIDHIATLRQVRLEQDPDPVKAAKEALAGGADGIVCHLREDRRHIQEQDVYQLRRLKTRLDLEMAATSWMLKFALKLKPDLVTIVPEKRHELTTEGGLEVGLQLDRYISQLKASGILVSLFIDPEAKQIKAASLVGADFVELHTGSYANVSAAKKKSALDQIKRTVQLAMDFGLQVNAGHGLDYNNVKPIVNLAGIEELNIGFAIIARAVKVGLRQAVKEMRRLVK